jgi:sn-glycerol 3-phosphate transport system substrate-binding protein
MVAIAVLGPVPGAVATGSDSRSPVGCGPAEISSPITITVWHDLSFAPADMLEALAGEFERANPLVTVELRSTVADGGAVAALASGPESPDVVLANQEQTLNLADSGLAVPLESCLDAESDLSPEAMLQPARDAVTVDGTLWALPVMVSTPVLYFDRAQFADAGVDPDIDLSTVSELRDALEVLRSRGVVHGLVTASPDWFVSAWAADLGVDLLPNGGRIAGGTAEFSVDDPELLARLTELGALGTDELVEVVSGEGFADLMMLTDPIAPAAMVAHSSGSMRTVYDLLIDGRLEGSELGVMPFPWTESGTVVGGPAAWLTSTEPSRRFASWDFIAFLGSRSSQARIGTLGYVPIRRDALDDPGLRSSWAESPGLQVPSDALWGDRTAVRAAWIAGPGGRIRWRLQWAVTDILDGRPARTALEDAATDIRSTLESYHRLRLSS